MNISKEHLDQLKKIREDCGLEFDAIVDSTIKKYGTNDSDSNRKIGLHLQFLAIILTRNVIENLQKTMSPDEIQDFLQSCSLFIEDGEDVTCEH